MLFLRVTLVFFIVLNLPHFTEMNPAAMQCSVSYSRVDRETPTSRGERTAASPQRCIYIHAICVSGPLPLHPPPSSPRQAGHVGWMNEDIFNGEVFEVKVEAVLTHPWCRTS